LWPTERVRAAPSTDATANHDVGSAAAGGYLEKSLPPALRSRQTCSVGADAITARGNAECGPRSASRIRRQDSVKAMVKTDGAQLPWPDLP